MTEARLLLVDDDVPHLDALAERLAGEGFEVAKAKSGREALERLDASWPDLVILDLMMPEMDGQTLAAKIKSRADLPILVLSAIVEADSNARVEELALGDITITPRRREATVRGRRVALSPTESRFLATLAASMPAAVSTEQLLHKVWADSDAADPAYVWVTVRRLRLKLELDPDNPIHLLTEPGGGYRLASAEMPPGTRRPNGP